MYIIPKENVRAGKNQDIRSVFKPETMGIKSVHKRETTDITLVIIFKKIVALGLHVRGLANYLLGFVLAGPGYRILFVLRGLGFQV